MTMKTIGKLAAALLLAVGLAGCVDATVDVAVTGADQAQLTMTQVMGAEVYGMLKMGGTQIQGGPGSGGGSASTSTDKGFCKDEGSTLTENADGSAVCTEVKQGTFAEIMASDTSEDTIKFAEAGPGMVRVSFPTAGMKGELGANDSQMDAQTKQMMQAFFTGHNLTLKVSGGTIGETNMTVSPDGQSATTVIPLLDLLNGTANLPDEVFAVLTTN